MRTSTQARNMYLKSAILFTIIIFLLNALPAISSTETLEYLYDNTSQLKKATTADGKWVSYDYDDSGNRTALNTSSSGGTLLPTPVAPNTPSPADGATVTTNKDFILSWQGGSASANDTVIYTVYFGTDPANLPILWTGTQTSYELFMILKPSTTYYWQVFARGNNLKPIGSPVWSFTTGADLVSVDGILESLHTIIEVTNSQELRTALATAQNNEGNYIIHLAEGTYALTPNDPTNPDSTADPFIYMKFLHGSLILDGGTDPSKVILDGRNMESTEDSAGVLGLSVNTDSGEAGIFVNGLTVMRGNGRLWCGGMSINSWPGNTAVTNCIIRDNYSSWDTGGLECWGWADSVNTIKKNLIFNNKAVNYGGGVRGIFQESCRCEFSDNKIYNNFSGAYDGGFVATVADSSTLNFYNNIVYGNNAEKEGGGAYVWNVGNGSTVNIINNTITNNTGPSYGAGLSLIADSAYQATSNIYNNIIWNNNGDDVYHFVYGTGVEVSHFYNNIYSSSGGDAYTYDDGALHINSDPMFVNESEFHLAPSSPAIDHGNNSAPGVPSKDYYEKERTNPVDIGAVEFDSTIDSTPPVKCVITSPKDWDTLTGASIIVTGTAEDNMAGVGLSEVDISIDNGPWQKASGTNNWSYEWYLLNGAHTIKARAVDRMSQSTPEYLIHVNAVTDYAAVTNDLRSAPKVITNLPYYDASDTRGATLSDDDPPACQSYTNNVWYSYTPSADGYINIDTTGSDYKTVLAVYTQASGQWNSIVCNQSCGDNTYSVYFHAVSGTTYLIMVGSQDNRGGSLTLNATNNPDGGAWTKQFGTESYDWSKDVSTDNCGNVYVCGITYGSLDSDYTNLDPSGNTSDCFVAKYDPNGKMLWRKQFGTEKDDSANNVLCDNLGNIYVIGTTWGSFDGHVYGSSGANVILVKFDSKGEKLWSAQFNFGDSYLVYYQSFGPILLGDSPKTYGCLDSLGNVYLAGNIQSNGNNDCFITKYTSGGVKSWYQKFGTSEYDGVGGISVDQTGNAYLCGTTCGAFEGYSNPDNNPDSFLAKFSSSGIKQWILQNVSPAHDGAASIALHGNDVFITGVTDGALGDGLVYAGGYDIFIIKYGIDSNGNANRIWTRQFGSAGDEYPKSSAFIDNLGNIYVAGETDGELPGNTFAGWSDTYVAKYYNNGDQAWIKEYGTADDGYEVYSLTGDGVDNIYLSGIRYTPLLANGFTLRYGVSGVLNGIKEIGTGTSDTEFYAAALDRNNNIYAVGDTDGSFPGYANAGSGDAIISKLSPSTVIIDNTPPVSTITAPAENQTIAGTSYIITGTASDAGSGVKKVQVSINGNLVDADGTTNWTHIWTPLPSDGIYTIQSYATDNAGNVETTGSTVTVTVDNTPPSGSISINNGAVDTSSKTVTLNISATDNGGTPAYMQTSNTGTLGNTWEPFATAKTWDLSEGSGTKTVSVWFKDAAGNISGVATANIEFEAPFTEQWVRQTGTFDYDSGNLVTTDSLGNSYIAAQTYGPFAASNKGVMDVVLMKYDATGAFKWSRQIGTSQYDYLTGIAVDGNNVYICGHTGGAFEGYTTNKGWDDAFVMKYEMTNNGDSVSVNPVWVKQFGSQDYDYAQGIGYWKSQNSDPDYLYIVGYTYGDMEPGTENTTPLPKNQGDGDIFLAKLDPTNGNLLWTDQQGSDNYDDVVGMTFDSSGNIFITGNTYGSLGSFSNVQDIWGGGNSDNVFVAKYDSLGHHFSVIDQMGTGTYDYPRGIAVNTHGEVYVTGSTGGNLNGSTVDYSPADLFIAKYSPNTQGYDRNIVQMGSPDWDEAVGVALDSFDKVYVAVNTPSAFDGNQWRGNQDIAVVKFDRDLNKVWSTQLGTEFNEYASGIGSDGTNIYLTGGIDGGGMDGNASAGSYDIFTMKLGSAGTAPPRSTIETPFRGSNIGGSTSIYGKAFIVRQGATIQKVEVSINGVWQEQTATLTRLSQSEELYEWNYVYDFSNQGTYIINSRATAVLADGTTQITEGVGEGIKVYYDTMAPQSAPDTVSAPLTGYGFTLTGTASEVGSGIRSILVTINGNGGYYAVDTSTNGSWSAWKCNVNPLPNGTFTVSSQATDMAGNIENPTNTVTITVDNPAPTCAITSPVSGATVSGTAVTIAGTAASDVGIWYILVSYDKENWLFAYSASINSINGNTANWSIDIPSLPNGTYTLYTRSYDYLYNTQATPTAVSFTVNNPVPAASISVPGTGSTLTGSTVTVNGSVSGVSTSTYGIQTVQLSTDGINWSYSAQDTSGAGDWSSWSATIPAPLNGESSTIYARALDGVGNSCAPASTTFSINNILATPAFTSPEDKLIISNPLNITGTTSGICTTGINRVELSFDGGANWCRAVDTSGNSSWSTWNYRWVPVDGYYNLICRVVDNIGNTGIVSETRKVTVNRTLDFFRNTYAYSITPWGTVDGNAYGLAADNGGHTYVIGRTPGEYYGLCPDVLIKFDSQGYLGYPNDANKWFTDVCQGQPKSIAMDNVNNFVYVAGCSNDDVFLTQYDTSGNLIRTSQLGSSNYDTATGTCVDNSGNTYITGYTAGNLDGKTNSGGNKTFVAKYTPNGDKAWTKLMDSTSENVSSGIVAGANGDTFFTGKFGNTSFIAKYDSVPENQSPQWITLGEYDPQEATGVAIDSFGEIYEVGKNNEQLLLIKYGSDGGVKWTKNIGLVALKRITGVTIFNNEIYIAGTNSDGAVFITRYNIDGNKLWTRFAGTNTWSSLNGISANASGELYVTGSSDRDFDSNNYNWGHAIFVAKVNTSQIFSAITDPQDGSTLTDASYTIKGIAGPGATTGISKVQISIDGGINWVDADDTSVDFTWSSWSYTLASMPPSGVYTLMSRVIDTHDDILNEDGITITISSQ